MKAIFVGRSAWTDVRIECAARFGYDVEVVETGSDVDLTVRGSSTPVVFIAAAADELLPTAEAAVRGMAHVYLDTDIVAPLSDAGLLVSRAREAGVQLSGTRPMLFDEQIQQVLEEGPARVLSVTSGLDSGGGWRRSLHAAVDLAGTLLGTFAARRIDVEVARNGSGVPVMALVSLRFLNGAFAHLHLGPRDSVGAECRIFAATDTQVRSIAFEPRGQLVKRETDAFLSALDKGSAAPVALQSVLDASALVENILRRLRQ